MTAIPGAPIAKETAEEDRNLSAAAIRFALCRETYSRFQRYRVSLQRTARESSPVFSITPSGRFMAIHVSGSASFSAARNARRLGMWTNIEYAAHIPTRSMKISKLLSISIQLERRQQHRLRVCRALLEHHRQGQRRPR